MRKNVIEAIKKYLKTSDKILIASHYSPDPDAVSATTFVLKILKKNYPQKTFLANIEDYNQEGWPSFIDTSLIPNEKLDKIVINFQPDLIFFLDVNELRLLTKSDLTAIIGSFPNKPFTIQIDHHYTDKKEAVDILINEKDNSCAETVYKLFIKKLNLKPYDNYQNDLLLGIIGDTGSFAYIKQNAKSTFRIASELVESGGNIDQVQQEISRVKLNELKIHQELLNNLTSNGEFSYSFISDVFFENNNFNEASYSSATKLFVQLYLKKIDLAYWGFIVKPKGDNNYSISMRAQEKYIDLTKFTLHLNGGGHKTSTGGLIQAKNDKDAIKQVMDVIEKYKEEAYANK